MGNDLCIKSSRYIYNEKKSNQQNTYNISYVQYLKNVILPHTYILRYMLLSTITEVMT